MTFDAHELARALRQVRGDALGGGYCVAWSGGLDSTALLHAMRELAAARTDLRLRALHVEHGLHPDAGRWASHCAAAAARLDVPLGVLRVQVASGGHGLEAAARDARYAALAANLAAGELLLTAHHLDDQAETVLLQLLRGAGPRGLSGMPAQRPLGHGLHLRPLLGFARDELLEYALRAGLEWLDDPANADDRFARSHLRRRIMPLLRARWPAAASNIARAAAHQAEVSALVEQAAAQAAAALISGDCLRADGLAGLDAPLQRQVLRDWIRRREFPVPGRRRLQSILDDVLHCRADAAPCVRWPGAELRRYRERLYVLTPLEPLPAPADIVWPIADDLELPAGLGRLRAVPAAGEGIRPPAGDELRITFRQGGEHIRPVGTAHRRALKNLFQEHGIVPWMRDRVPLVHTPAGLAAVAGLWREHAQAAAPGEPGLRIEWLDGPSLY